MTRTSISHQKIKFLQINVGRSKAAHNLLEQNAKQLGIGIILVSEPNNNIVTNGPWLTDKECNAAIKITNSKLRIRRRKKRRGYVWANIGGFRIFSCYISPNVDMHVFKNFLHSLGEDTKRTKKKVVIAGDFNAKSFEWACESEDERGRYMNDWMAENELVVQNNGSNPTFVRREQRSIIDITLSCGNAAQDIINWSVREEESLSLHRYIYFELSTTEEKGNPNKSVSDKRWRTNKLQEKRSVFTNEVKHLMESGNTTSATQITNNIIEAGTKSGLYIHPKKTNRNCYWWNETLSLKYKELNQIRRKLTRDRKKNLPTTLIIEQETLMKDKRKDFQKLIQKSKDDQWKQLIEEVEKDPWGLGYKIVMRKLKKQHINMEAETRIKAIEILFPQKRRVNWIRKTDHSLDMRDITSDEVVTASKKLKNKKAPGLDGIPVEVIKIVAEELPEVMSVVLNNIYRTARMPIEWKTARLILVPKPGKDPSDPSAYRPLSLLGSMTKLYEQIITNRLCQELEEGNKLSEFQYGFRKGKSTVDCIKVVVDMARKEIGKTRRTRSLCMMISLDIKNAFNSLSWRKIIGAANKKNLNKHLIEVLKDYLEDRVIIDEEGQSHKVSAGVPQGSILGPHLWNLSYDEVLHLKVPEGVKVIAYADDLAVIVLAKTREMLQEKAEGALKRVLSWLKDMELELAVQKTEAVVLSGQKKCPDMWFMLDGVKITPKTHVTYLGIVLDKNLTFRKHIQKTAKKAIGAANALGKILPNKRGAGENRRRAIGSVVRSIMLYGSPIWYKALDFKCNKAMMDRVDRTVALRIARAYRTVSTSAVLVIARWIPTVIIANERCMLYKNKNEDRNKLREDSINKWQMEWDSGTTGRWTHKIISDLSGWCNRAHGEVTYELCQILSGHGSFRSYLYKIKKATDDLCVNCKVRDDAEHAMFNCTLFEIRRATVNSRLQAIVSPENLIKLMLDSEENWNIVANYASEIIEVKRRSMQN